jgi:hypothetical protein
MIGLDKVARVERHEFDAGVGHNLRDPRRDAAWEHTLSTGYVRA